MEQAPDNVVIAPIAEPAYYSVRHRARFSKDNSGLLKALILAITILIGLLWFFIFVQIGTRVPPLHFPLTENMQLIQPMPLDQEGMSKAALLNWINDMVTTAFSFNYSNQDKQESRLKEYFSDNAMQQYNDLLKFDNDFNQIGQKLYVVSVVPTTTPDIVDSKSYYGRYAWQIHVTARVTFSNAILREAQEVAMDFLVMRVPVEQQPLGIIVQSFNRTVTGRLGAQRVQQSGF